MENNFGRLSSWAVASVISRTVPAGSGNGRRDTRRFDGGATLLDYQVLPAEP